MTEVSVDYRVVDVDCVIDLDLDVYEAVQSMLEVRRRWTHERVNNVVIVRLGEARMGTVTCEVSLAVRAERMVLDVKWYWPNGNSYEVADYMGPFLVHANGRVHSVELRAVE